ncbi:alpha/beta fold hydrolase [Paraburkholderia nodosa]|uniref:alpha/beta fold hydrolase n=1 Tax=Paraburkholderia nodosa TaxID=392320 RepID=UPI000486EC39|nr:hypothetical protein [Paraburkholderia nodosa]
MPTPSKVSIVFIRGIWEDGSCFAKVIPILPAEGYDVIAAQYGLDMHAGDVTVLRGALGRGVAPVLLIGLSYRSTRQHVSRDPGC